MAISFTTPVEKTSALAERSGTRARVLDESFRLILRLVQDTVVTHHGILRFDVDEGKTEMVISVQLPVERRHLIEYRSEPQIPAQSLFDLSDRSRKS